MTPVHCIHWQLYPLIQNFPGITAFKLQLSRSTRWERQFCAKLLSFFIFCLESLCANILFHACPTIFGILEQIKGNKSEQNAHCSLKGAWVTMFQPLSLQLHQYRRSSTVMGAETPYPKSLSCNTVAKSYKYNWATEKLPDCCPAEPN